MCVNGWIWKDRLSISDDDYDIRKTRALLFVKFACQTHHLLQRQKILLSAAQLWIDDESPAGLPSGRPSGGSRPTSTRLFVEPIRSTVYFLFSSVVFSFAFHVRLNYKPSASVSYPRDWGVSLDTNERFTRTTMQRIKGKSHQGFCFLLVTISRVSSQRFNGLFWHVSINLVNLPPPPVCGSAQKTNQSKSNHFYKYTRHYVVVRAHSSEPRMVAIVTSGERTKIE